MKKKKLKAEVDALRYDVNVLISRVCELQKEIFAKRMKEETHEAKEAPEKDVKW